MRILLLNLYFPPDTSATATMAQIVVQALQAKHEVTVLCGRPSYDSAERHPWRLWYSETRAGVRVVRAGSTVFPRHRMRQRVVNYLSYVALAVPLSLFLPCDVVLAMTDPPFEGIVGAFIALLKRRPFVYNIRDLYPDMALGGSLIPEGWLSRLWERLHRWALRRATRIIVLGEDMRERIVAKDVEATRVAVVRDGADLSAMRAPAAPADPEVVGAIRGEFDFVLLHAGNLGFSGAWETLIEAARLLEKSEPGIGLVFVGEGAERDRLAALASGCKSVRFLPFFPRSKIPSVMAAGDVHVITVKRALEGAVVPSKLYGILAAGKPLLVAAPAGCDAARIAVARGCGLAVDPDKPQEAAAAARSLAGDPERVRRMGEAARAAVSDYDRLRELRRFVEIVEEARNA
ncbi:MAG TPA: glycosyltransferase family 4 protein [Candidatus Acidoferrales bacterium]|nr:glycosyltransferase family 4 protein [Candidatus Acidoferrales bacterium]